MDNLGRDMQLGLIVFLVLAVLAGLGIGGGVVWVIMRWRG